jgi:Zn-dependent protease
MENPAAFVGAVAVWALPVLFAITVHEIAHGYVARELGDDTAARAGRLSLNPLRHVDPFGTVIVPALLLLVGGFLFGWAKPVPVDFRRLRHPRRDMAIVAAAGPAVNLAMALGWAVLQHVVEPQAPRGGVAAGVALMAGAGTTINIVMAVLNLLPVPPLDGGRVAVGLLPLPAARALARLEPFGMVLMLLLLASGLLSAIMVPAVVLLERLLQQFVGALF